MHLLKNNTLPGMGNRVWNALDLSLAQFRKSIFENIKNWNETSNHQTIVAERVDGDSYLNGISVIYRLNDQYHHVICSTYLEADQILQTIAADDHRMPVGIFNAATNHFDWEITGQYHFETDPVNKKLANANERIISIAESLRRRDATWRPNHFQRASFFA